MTKSAATEKPSCTTVATPHTNSTPPSLTTLVTQVPNRPELTSRFLNSLSTDAKERAPPTTDDKPCGNLLQLPIPTYKKRRRKRQTLPRMPTSARSRMETTNIKHLLNCTRNQCNVLPPIVISGTASDCEYGSDRSDCGNLSGYSSMNELSPSDFSGSDVTLDFLSASGSHESLPTFEDHLDAEQEEAHDTIVAASSLLQQELERAEDSAARPEIQADYPINDNIPSHEQINPKTDFTIPEIVVPYSDDFPEGVPHLLLTDNETEEDTFAVEGRDADFLARSNRFTISSVPSARQCSTKQQGAVPKIPLKISSNPGIKTSKKCDVKEIVSNVGEIRSYSPGYSAQAPHVFETRNPTHIWKPEARQRLLPSNMLNTKDACCQTTDSLLFIPQKETKDSSCGPPALAYGSEGENEEKPGIEPVLTVEKHTLAVENTTGRPMARVSPTRQPIERPDGKDLPGNLMVTYFQDNQEAFRANTGPKMEHVPLSSIKRVVVKPEQAVSTGMLARFLQMLNTDECTAATPTFVKVEYTPDTSTRKISEGSYPLTPCSQMESSRTTICQIQPGRGETQMQENTNFIEIRAELYQPYNFNEPPPPPNTPVLPACEAGACGGISSNRNIVSGEQPTVQFTCPPQGHTYQQVSRGPMEAIHQSNFAGCPNTYSKAFSHSPKLPENPGGTLCRTREDFYGSYKPSLVGTGSQKQFTKVGQYSRNLGQNKGLSSLHDPQRGPLQTPATGSQKARAPISDVKPKPKTWKPSYKGGIPSLNNVPKLAPLRRPKFPPSQTTIISQQPPAVSPQANAISNSCQQSYSQTRRQNQTRQEFTNCQNDSHMKPVITFPSSVPNPHPFHYQTTTSNYVPPGTTSDNWSRNTKSDHGMTGAIPKVSSWLAYETAGQPQPHVDNSVPNYETSPACGPRSMQPTIQLSSNLVVVPMSEAPRVHVVQPASTVQGLDIPEIRMIVPTPLPSDADADEE